jgi:biopolymer transport protein ExbB
VGDVVELARKGRLMDAADACKQAGGPVASVLATLMRTLDRPRDEREQIVIVAGNREIRQMERGLRGIAVIARIAPLLGLLGTVVGLVEAFLAVSTMQGPPDPSVLASGIWQALLTTVAGLLVAIPAILSHEWLQSRVDEVALQMQEALTEVLASVSASLNSGESPGHDPVPAKSTAKR